MNPTEESRSLPLVLLIDDIVENLAVLGKILEQDYHVRFALSGQKGLELAKTEPPPDLILLDIQMPFIDGFEVCRRLKADPQTTDIPVIFVTAQDEIADEMMGLKLGGVDFITKPIVPEIVLARIHTHLSLSRALKDLTNQRKILEENNRLREEIDQLCRHDLKTPLTAILGVPELLMDSENLTDDQRQLIGLVYSSGQKMLNMINNSLTLYKIEQGTFTYQPHRIDVCPLLFQLSQELQSLLRQKALVLLMTMDDTPLSPEDCFELEGDPILLGTALGNLLKNAIEASPPSSAISLHLSKTDRARIAIHNFGAIPTSLRGKFFHKFATAGKSGGTGLGAYSAKTMTNVMGGDIQMTTDDTTGTTITISLPPWTSPIREEPQILLVDDTDTNREWFFHMLRSIGYSRITTLRDATLALAYLQENHVDIIVSDCFMPGLSGMDFVRKIRGEPRWKSLSIVLYSAAEDTEVRELAVASGANVFLPFFSPREQIEQVFKSLWSAPE